jgi:fibronectin-binding autotransporter adhesin
MLSCLRSSRFVLALALVAWTGSVHAAGIIRITEVQSSSGVGGTADWFEITNYGTAAVDITGWKMDDNSFSVTSGLLLVPYTVGTDPAWSLLLPGESAVMLEGAATSVPAFQTFWNLGAEPSNIRNPKLGTYSGSGASFGSGGDGVAVFDATGTEITRVVFGAATTGSTFYWSYDATGSLATAAGGQVSQPGVAFGYATSSTPSNTGSPGIAAVATPTSTSYWTANGTTLGGAGTWNATNSNWSPTTSPVSPQIWGDGATAVFQGTGGTVTVGGAVAPLGLTFASNGYTLAAGTGSISTSTVQVNTGLSATIGARLTGSGGLTLLGGGTLLVSGTTNDYAGITSVAEGTFRAAASEVIPDGSRLSVSRYMTADLSGYSETVNGIAGLGTIVLGNALTVNITGSADIVLDGFLRGTGDLIIDSAGTGAQRLDASTATLTDGAVKDYSGRTIVQRGTLKIHYDGIPSQTSGLDVEAAGILRLETTGQPYSIGPVGAPVTINVKGGTLGQGIGDDVTLVNPVNVTADSTFSILNTTTPDPANPTTEQMILSGPLTGTAGRTITVTASNTTPGADKGRVAFSSPSGNTFVGTVRPQVNAVARFTGNYSGVSVALDQGKLDGSGTVGAVSGTGTISPEGDLGPGILTATGITTSATTAFEFDFSTKNAEPVWFSPTASENDVLRLTGSTPLPTPLASGNAVRLFLNVASLAQADTFTGGFFTTADSTAAIAGASYSTYVYGDGLGVDYSHNDVSWYTLANWNTKQSSTLSATISMVPTAAAFDGSTQTSGYVMRASYGTSSNIVIDVPSGSQTQAQAGHAQILVADSVTKTGAGTLVMDAANSYMGPTTVSAGTLQVANAGAVASSPVTVASGATLSVASGTTMKSPSVTVSGGTVAAETLAVNGSTGVAALTINSGTIASTTAVVVGPGGLVDLPDAARLSVGVASLAVDQAAGGGKIDLGAGQVTIAAGGITAADLRADIIAGRSGGSWAGAAGITSATAAATPGTRAVGYAVAGDGSAKVSFAAPGDTNLDGLVNFSDIQAIINGGRYGQSGTTGVWGVGDFNYDGLVNFTDIQGMLTAGRYGQASYFPAAPSGASLGGLGAPVAVPEPATTTAVLIAAVAVGLMLRRRSAAA